MRWQVKQVKMSKTLLLHICCAPCSLLSLRVFQESGYSILGYFFNPNIHPYREFVRRKETLRGFLEKEEIPYVIDEGYPLEEFLEMTRPFGKDRCRRCYSLRLEAAARLAQEKGIGYFSSSLLISPYQKHEQIRELGEELADRYGLKFVYEDLRPFFRESLRLAREREFYIQGYCGCIFSEKERYAKSKK